MHPMNSPQRHRVSYGLEMLGIEEGGALVLASKARRKCVTGLYFTDIRNLGASGGEPPMLN